jgi:hypothetical protein
MSFINGIFSAEELHDYLAQRSMNWDYSPVMSMKGSIGFPKRTEALYSKLQQKF